MAPQAHGLTPIGEALGAAMLWGLGTVLGRFLGRRLAFEHVTTVRFAFGLLASAIALPIVGADAWAGAHDSLWITYLALVTGLAGSWLISRSLVRPLNELRQAMAVVGAGDLDHAVEPSSRDEIGELARAFARMTEQLRQSRAQLVQSEKLASIGQMAAAVAHGLRNPLASLRAAAQLAQRRVEGPPPAAREQLQAIIEQVDRLDLRIAHLLAFSRPAPFRPLRESVRALVEGALGGFSELLRQHRVEPTLSFAAALPEVRVDPMRLEQALTEIFSNALDAMPDGGRLAIQAQPESVESGAAGVALEITDSGRGIPAEILANVCEPFFTTRPEGTGLGLATAKRYVEEAGGRLEITSVVGRGTTVRLWLPVPSGDAAPPAPPAPPVPQAAAPGPPAAIPARARNLA